MSVALHAVVLDAHDPAGLARFWSEVLGRQLDADGVTLLPSDPVGFRLRFSPTTEARTGPLPMHVDLTSSSPADQAAQVDRVLALGGRHHDVGQLPEEEHVVLADPEGNEFCVVEPGNGFLAGCGALGALSCDGSREVGLFWSTVLGWPLVWDQGEETAVQSRAGGPKIAWGGLSEPVTPGRNRIRFELRADAGTCEDAVRELVSRGATRVDAVPGTGDRVTLADPDGLEFWVFD